jgi:ribonucleoside-diphosphate reductase 2, operon protein nrdI
MKIVYISRTGNVETIVQNLEVKDAVRIETGDETVSEDFILITYTDGYGDIPMELEGFLSNHNNYIKGVIVSGDTGYGEAYGGAGDAIAEQYNVPLLYKLENEGTDEDIAKIKDILDDFNM